MRPLTTPITDAPPRHVLLTEPCLYALVTLLMAECEDHDRRRAERRIMPPW
ncbi:hypothetical protein ACIHCQ_35020 [Streptomyces sp. NPDC052236]|uniref:hypothetical protein n=1 Tax=Streptomyces sp. NPDC052236 TaxID=3365686 RepID=UPI0037D175F5